MQNYGAYLLSWWGVFWSPLQDYGRNSMPQSIPWMHRLPLQLVPKHQDASFYACRKMGDTERREALSHHLQLLSGRLVNFWIHTTDTVTLYKLGGGTQKKTTTTTKRAFYMSALRPLSQWLLKQKTTHVKEEVEELLKQMYEMIKGTSLVWFETFPLWWSHVGFHSLRRDENPPWLRLLSVFAWICYTCKYKVYTFKTAFVGISTQTLYIRNWHFDILWVSPHLAALFALVIHHSCLNMRKLAQKQLIILSEAAC